MMKVFQQRTWAWARGGPTVTPGTGVTGVLEFVE